MTNLEGATLRLKHIAEDKSQITYYSGRLAGAVISGNKIAAESAWNALKKQGQVKGDFDFKRLKRELQVNIVMT